MAVTERMILMADSIKTYYLKDGRKRYSFRIYTGINPKTHKPSQTTKRGFCTYEEAKQAQQAIQARVKNGTYWQKSADTFYQVYLEWKQIKAIAVKPATLLTYEAHIQSFQSLFLLPINQITPTHIAPIFVKLKQTLSSQQSLDAKWSFLNMLFDYAFNCRYIKWNPLVTMSKPSLHRQKEETPNFLTEAELQLFLETVKKENFKYYCLCRLAAMSGMRIGELMALTWDDIDFYHQKIAINKNDVLDLHHRPILSTPKTKNANRIIDIDAQTLAILKQWHQQNRHQLLFPDRNGKLANTDIPKTWIIRFRHKHPELKPISFHGFRHTHASMLFQHHVPAKIIQQRLGHSSIKITLDIYTHLDKQSETDSLQRFFNELNH